MPDLDILRQLTRDVGVDTARYLLGIFKKDADRRIGEIKDYLQNGGDIAHLRLQAHSLKSLCDTYGAPNGGNAAGLLQEACESGDDANIKHKAETACAIITDEIQATLQAAQTLIGGAP